MAKKKGPQLTMSVPEAGEKYFDIGRNASYRAADRGEIPSFRIGKRIIVPRVAIEKKLESVA